MYVDDDWLVLLRNGMQVTKLTLAAISCVLSSAIAASVLIVVASAHAGVTFAIRRGWLMVGRVGNFTVSLPRRRAALVRMSKFAALWGSQLFMGSFIAV